MYCPDCNLPKHMFGRKTGDIHYEYYCDKCYVLITIIDGNERFVIKYRLNYHNKTYELHYSSCRFTKFCNFDIYEVDSVYKSKLNNNNVIETDIIITPFSPIKPKIEKLLKNYLLTTVFA